MSVVVKVSAALAALAVIAGLVTFLTGTKAGQEASLATEPLATPHVLETSQPGVTVPTLSPDQQTAVVDIALADEGVKKLFSIGDVADYRVAPWHRSKGLELIGGVMEVTLERPATITGEFLGMSWDEERYPDGYVSWRYRAGFGNVTQLIINVDLRYGKVAGISVLRGATVIATPAFEPGFTPPPSRPQRD